MKPITSSRSGVTALASAAALSLLASVAVITAVSPAGATTSEKQAAAARSWPSTPDGFAALPGNGRGPTTGGAGGQTVTVTNQADLNKYVTAAEPYIIKVAGTINISPKGTELRVGSNKTIVGVGTKGEIVGGGFFLKAGVSNVIIRNLTIRDTRMPDDDPGDDSYDYDAIQIDTANHIWIDHNRLTRMNDGLLDSRKDTTNLTVSWNHFVENNKTFGIGWTDNVTSKITIHHNWFQNTNSRNPSADNIANLHMYNNYLQNITGYGNFVRGKTKAVIENSYYDTVKDPYYVEAGELVQRGNIVVNSTWGSGKVKEKGTAFDPRSFYSYTLDPAADVPGLLRTYAGPQANIGT
ncbi:pectate lyase family protein [Nonomuraea sp. KM90]|uniref:pectate lyase family protein n=1 Tax=Nonomuraea sp. KM90 TaxID=3457428 RepID=UPI003FCE7DF6